MCVCVVGAGGAWGCLEVAQWEGWLGQEHDLDLERRHCLRVMVQGRGVGWGVRRWGGWVRTPDEKKICFWNMHGQWNKTKGEGERVRQEIIQDGWE